MEKLRSFASKAFHWESLGMSAVHSAVGNGVFWGWSYLAGLEIYREPRFWAATFFGLICARAL